MLDYSSTMTKVWYTALSRGYYDTEHVCENLNTVYDYKVFQDPGLLEYDDGNTITFYGNMQILAIIYLFIRK